jgi:hypothetical protein
MRSSDPPIVATWLLIYLLSGKENESLIGDLVEDYGRGRSNSWYWRQALTAIAVSFWREISTHRLLAIKATATGWLAFYLFQSVYSGMLSRFHLWLPLYRELPLFLGYGTAARVYKLILWTPIWVGSGWLMSRLYRAHLACMVLVFSTSVLACSLLRLPWTIHLLFDAVSDPRYLPQLIAELMNMILPFVCVVLGGLITSRSRPDYLAS